MRQSTISIPLQIIFALLILLAFGIRAYALEADAPPHLSVSQGLTTDNANTVYAGRNKVLFGQWSPDIDGYPPVNSTASAMSWLSYLTFALLGVGYWQSGFLAVMISMLTISVVVAFARSHFGNRAALLASVFLITNYIFVVYNRLPVAFTLAGLNLALILYFMARSARSPRYLILSIGLAFLGVVSVKIAVIASIPMIAVGLSLIIQRRMPSGRLTARHLLLIIAVLVAIAFMVVILSPAGRLFSRLVEQRTIHPSNGLAENIRFLVTSILEFGIYSAFFIRMMPLFVFSYGYLLLRAAQLVSRKLPRLSFAEIMALFYLLGIIAMLVLSNQQPTRHLVLLIPPMSLISALVVDNLFRLKRLETSTNLGYLFPIVIFVGLTYLFYHVLAAGYRAMFALRLSTNVGDYSTITPMPVLHLLMFIALVPGFLVTMLILVHVSGTGERLNTILTRRRIRLMTILLVVFLIATDLAQYVLWARSPEYTLVTASSQIREDLGDNVTLGGAFAAVLSLENDYPGKIFFEKPLRSPEYQQRVIDSGLTHLAMEAESIFGDIPINVQEMKERIPEFFDYLELVESYYVRGYTVNVYEID